MRRGVSQYLIEQHLYGRPLARRRTPNMFCQKLLFRASVLAACLLSAAVFAADAPGHRGGKLRLLASSSGGTIDPQVNYTLKFAQLYVSIYDGLVTFKKAAGAESVKVVPDLAEALPVASDGAKTFVFTLRRGVQFSSGREVTVDDVAASYRRIFKVSSPTAGTFYNLIVGADACIKVPATCTLAGGVITDKKLNTITFHLTKPDPEFLDKVAFGHAVIVPAESPTRDVGVNALPGTGPYMVASYDSLKELKLVRNPHFKVWSTDAQPDGYVDEIDYDFGLAPEDAVTAIANGQADWFFDEIPADRLNELGTRFAKQLVITPLTAGFYFPMNVRLAPFDNLKARQAVALAVDRKAAVKLIGGVNLATPTCQVLPPGLPGYEPYCPWTKNPGATWTAPDLERARQLVKESGTAGAKVTFVTADTAIGRALGTYMQGVLTDIGYDANVKVLAQSLQLIYIQNTNNKVQISLLQWYQDYPAPSDFLNVLLACASFHPGSDASINIPGICDPELDAQMARALDQALTDEKAANALWAAIDKKATDAAYLPGVFTPKHLDFTSKRLGNFVFSSQTYFVPALAWVQ
jgi:peptide/nickel transport system substrate-binding protein